jgi:aryl-alcohol dehydrogenase-like predicted oxidoreductase
LLDTAPWYGHGTSEIVVGWALEEILSNKDENNDNNKPRDGETTTINSSIAREDLCINTKVGRYEADPKQQFDFSRIATLESAQRSLERLRCGYIDVLQLHDPEFSPTLNVLLEETIPAMVECRDKGWCRALGLTGYPLEVQHQILTHSLEQYGTENSRRIWDQALTYGHFNLHDSSLVHRRVNPSRASFAEFCHHNKLGVLAAAPLSMGLLTHSEPPDWHPANNSELAKACAEAAGICKGLGVNIADLAILYAISHPSLPCTILGMKNKQQVECAVSLASRFQMVDWGIPELTQEMVLSFVLTVPEKRALGILRDGENGPFADVWRKETTEDYDGHGGAFRPKYQWDGIREVHEFWKSVEGASYEDWQDKSFR